MFLSGLQRKVKKEYVMAEKTKWNNIQGQYVQYNAQRNGLK